MSEQERMGGMRRAQLSLMVAAGTLGLLLAGLGLAEDGTPVAPVGKTIAPFRLPDGTGKTWASGDGTDVKAQVVVFLGTECPINNAYLPRLAELHRTYSPRGVRFVGINANRQDSAQRVAEHARQHAVPFPVLKDEGNIVADRFEAEQTPEVFLLDAAHVVRYRGRIDDQFGLGYRRPRPTRHDLAEALDEVLAGKAVTRPSTPVAGCYIARTTRPRPGATVTYTGHVAALLQRHCQECHRPSQIGPMPLLTYEDAAAWSATLRREVAARRMPPWHADPRHGAFSNCRRLSDQDRQTLLDWVDQGCARGEGPEPPPRAYAEGWRIGAPDVVLSMPGEFTVPASTKRGLPYHYIIVPTHFDGDRWVQAAEARPGNREVVHHIIVSVRAPGKEGRDRVDGIGEGFLAAYAPGDLPSVFPPGTAKKVPKGSILVFQMHYTPNGIEQKDRSSVGLIFAKEPPQHEARTRSIAQSRFTIPAGAADHEVRSASTFTRDAVLLSLFPHMHLRGKSFHYEAVFPDGRRETLLDVPRYDFAWQTNYRLATPLPLPAGTRIECTAHFDNSEANPNNPDPTQAIRWGEQTWEEMMIGFVDYYYVGKGTD